MGIRRVVAAASLTSFLAAGAIASAPADAQTPVEYRSKSDATALHLALLGEQLTIGLSESGIDASPAAAARAVGALLPGLGILGEEQADLANPGDDQPTCSPVALPAALSVVRVSIACGLASTAGDPRAQSTAGVASVAVSATSLLNDTPLASLPVEETVDQLLGGLAPVFEVVEELGLDAESLVSELLAGITQGGDLLVVELGPSAANAGAGDSSTLAEGLAQGAVIRVIDRSLLNLPPVLTIEVGAAATRVEADRTTGEAIPIVDPSLVRVTVAPDVAAILGLPADPIEVAPGTELCLPLPDPLASCITVAGGRTLDTPDGGKRAESEGVGLRLLTGLPEGGIFLALAASSAEAAAVPPATPAAPAVEAPRQEPLARTGIESTLPLALGLAAAGAAGLRLRRRLA